MDHRYIGTALYEGSVPTDLMEASDQLYGHLHSSSVYYSVYGFPAESINTWSLGDAGKLRAVLMFYTRDDTVHVINEQCTLTADVIERFASDIFSLIPGIGRIRFSAIVPPAEKLTYPNAASKRTQDIVLQLPADKDAYMAALGKSTRAYVKRYLNKLRRCHPTASWSTKAGTDASEEHVRAIIELNRARMAGKYKSSYIDEAEIKRILQMVERCGLVTVLTIEGRVCAGTINYNIGDNYFLQVVAHDPAYDEFGLGTLACYLAINECIDLKGKTYHFLWGRYEYKFRLLGTQTDLVDMTVYRDRWRMLKDTRTVICHRRDGALYELKDWIEERSRRQGDSSILAQTVFRVFNAAKKAKRELDRVRLERRAQA